MIATRKNQNTFKALPRDSHIEICRFLTPKERISLFGELNRECHKTSKSELIWSQDLNRVVLGAKIEFKPEENCFFIKKGRHPIPFYRCRVQTPVDNAELVALNENRVSVENLHILYKQAVRHDCPELVHMIAASKKIKVHSQ